MCLFAKLDTCKKIKRLGYKDLIILNHIQYMDHIAESDSIG